MPKLPVHPFGTEIKTQDIVEQMTRCRSWEDKYRFIIQLGKKLPVMDAQLKSQTIAISGCESQVWLLWRVCNGQHHFAADSDARIVKGLLAIIIAAIEGKSVHALNTFDFESYFEQLDLLMHLSQSRNNGIRAIVDKIRTIPL